MAAAQFQFDAYKALEIISSRSEECRAQAQDLLQLQGWSAEHRQQALNLLSTWLFEPSTLEIVLFVCRGVITELVHRSLVRKPFATPTQASPISCALSKILLHCPQVKHMVVEYFNEAPALMLGAQLALSGRHDDVNQLTPDEQDLCLKLLQAAYRLLKVSVIEFRERWNWSVLFPLTMCPSKPVAHFAFKCLAMVLGLVDKEVSVHPLMQSFSHDQDFVSKFDDEELQNALAFQKLAVHVGLSSSLSGADVTVTDFEAPVVDICGYLVAVNQNESQTQNDTDRSDKMDFFPETARANLAAVTLAVCKGNPILLSGPTGSGKTHTIQELAKRTKNDAGLIKIHLGDQSDAKVLLGSYVCTDVPGEFRWVAGALTKAVTEGSWLVIEDIDLAPTDVLSVLIPLLQKRRLFIASRGEEIVAAPGFQLFATQTQASDGSVSSRHNAAAQLLGGFWTRVHVEPLPFDELEQVIRYQFPHLGVLAPRFIHTFKLLVTLRDGSPSEIAELVEGASSVPELTQLRVGRFVSTRDLMKWCRRVVGLIGDDATQETMHKHISSKIRELSFREAADCFAGGIRHDALRNFVSLVIARCWDISEDRANAILHQDRPQLTETPSIFQIGRVALPLEPAVAAANKAVQSGPIFAYTRMSLELMEKIAQCVSHQEPVLLVGETGAGKTSTIQHLARKVGRKLVVLNMNQQSDSADLLGGFRPVELRLLCYPLKQQFERIFCRTFSKTKNKSFLDRVEQAFAIQNWPALIALFWKAVQLADNKFAERNRGNAEAAAVSETAETGVRPSKLRKVTEGQTASPVAPALSENELEWQSFKSAVSKFEMQHKQLKNAFAFSFVEGALVRAVQDGSWVLLDEINLASQETLESISGLLDGDSLVLSERGDVEPVQRHPHFRLLACMNPATDVGKKDLPPALRNRFSEFVLREMTQPEDLMLLVNSYLRGLTQTPPISEIVQFYLAARQEAETTLSDGANQRPHFSLRTLARALEYTRDTLSVFGNFDRALIEGLATSFLTQLDSKSYNVMRTLIKKFVQTKTSITDKMLERAPRCPSDEHVQFEQFWLELGPLDPFVDPHYILTPSIKQHLIDLGRILTSRKYPVLIQGPTSAGKTSMIEFLARRTGHRFVRINNHEHTDIQEYIGQYISDSQGRLIFQEGILVEAVRNGYWVVLDELNLAPSEVLEALNRLLDDNRELFIPETQQIVKPHPHFMLFATQNPPGLYGGRKNLSRAFRNRFIELHFDEIPDEELETILRERCFLPQSYCRQLIAIMKDMQRQRQGSQVFAGRHGLITLRDLFRWAERQPRDYQELATHGYMLLADRLRDKTEQDLVKSILEKHLRVELNIDEIYETEFRRLVGELEVRTSGPAAAVSQLIKRIVWTKSAKRLFALVYTCLRFREPVLLVGETGTGKTTVCQVLAELLGQTLHILNCHQHTETADFLGGLRPVRGKDVVGQRLRDNVAIFLSSLSQTASQLSIDLSTLPRSVEELNSFSSSDVIGAFEEARSRFVSSLKGLGPMDQILRLSVGHMMSLAAAIDKIIGDFKSLFQWYDGPLVNAMRSGDIFLVDEISLAEDAVLERLNSILEPSRTLTLAEKGGAAIEELHSHPDFRILATMNPGGDFGKKELSPALRNRFTEIWVPAISARSDLKQILDERFASQDLAALSDIVLDFIEFFNAKQYGASKNSFSLRDILSWVDFIKLSHQKLGSSHAALIHGAHMILLDGLGITHPLSAEMLKKDCLQFLLQRIISDETSQSSLEKLATLDRIVMDPEQMTRLGIHWTDSDTHFGIGPFLVEKAGDSNTGPQKKSQYTFRAPTTSSNLVRLLRGLQLPKPILLEGSPGVGKTSLVEALGALCGRKVVRINLSEQTDMLDLLGADLPQEDDFDSSTSVEPSFAWRDGIFLDALRAGDWVLLDEMNLANQSVLEGLNAVLDHRGSVFIPELNRTFFCPPTFRIFACQNPTQQGGGRKGLPKSFLNRFTKVYLDQFTPSDLQFVATTIFPSLPASTVASMIKFNQELAVETMEKFLYARQGAPWEFNLRDIIRWCQLVESSPNSQPGDFVDMLYLQRLRTAEDRKHVCNLYKRVFGEPLRVEERPYYSVDPYAFQIGSVVLPRASLTDGATIVDSRLDLLHSHLAPLESMMRCVKMGWLPILIGSSASGKSSIVQLLADLCGHELHVFSLNSSVDTIELLGGFEQVDLKRHREELIKELRLFVYAVLREAFTLHKQDADIPRLSQLFLTFCSSLKNSTFSSEQQAFSEDQERLVTNLLNTAASIVGEDVEKAQSANRLMARVKRIQTMNSRSSTGCFEWADGILIKAMKNGDWILMDNVNLCANPVLDRLLPLLEPNGYLALNERGIINGEIPKIVPHPNFRIFFAMDPKNGEISRAMRNRGLEFVLLPEQQLMEATNTNDHVRLLLQRGFEAREAQELATIHHHVCANGSGFTMRDLVTWSDLALELQQRGHDALSSRRIALSIYAHISVQDDASLVNAAPAAGVAPQSASNTISIASDSSRGIQAQLLRAFVDVTDSTSAVSVLRTALVCISRLNPLSWKRFLDSAARILGETMPMMGTIFSSFLSAVHNSSAVQQMHELRSQDAHPLQTWLQVSKESLGSVATDLSLNEGFLHHLQRASISLPESNLLERLPTILSFAMVHALESSCADAVREGDIASTEQSPLQQAVAYSIGKMDARSLSHPLVPLIPTILETIDSIVLEFVNGKDTVSNAEHNALLNLISTWRLLWSLHCQARREFFNPVLLILLLRWAKKMILKVVGKDDDVKLSSVLSRSQQTVWQSQSLISSHGWNFWRKSGHPIVLGKKELSDVSVSFRPLLRQMEFDLTDSVIKSFGSADSRSTILDALSTLYWAQIAGDENLPQRDEVLGVLSLLPAQLSSELQAVESVTISSLDPAQAAVMTLWEMEAQNRERAIVASLAQFVAATRSATASLPASIVADMKDFIHTFGNRKSSRSPVDFVPYKVLVWIADSSESANASVASLVQEAVVRHLLRPSRSLLALNPTILADEDAPVSEVSDIALSRFDVSIKDPLIFALSKDWSDVSVLQRESKLEILRDAIALVSESKSGSAGSESDWTLINSLFSDTLLCLEVSPASADQVRDLCRSLLDSSSAAPVDSAALRHILSSQQQALNKLCIDHLCNVADAVTFYRQESNKSSLDCWRRRGDAFASLGFVRALLLLPAEPIDPCMKKQVLFEALGDILSQLKHQQQCHSLDESIATGRSSNVRVKQLQLSIDLAEQMRKKSEVGVVRRPESTPMETFRSLHDDAHNIFADGGLCSPDRIANVVRGLRQVDILRGEGAQALAEESSWQNTVSQAMMALVRKYPDFLDVSGPLVAAVRLMQRGIRVTRIAAELQAPVESQFTLFDGCMHIHEVADVLLRLLPNEELDKSASRVDQVVLSPLTSAALSALVKLGSTKSSNGQTVEVLRLHSALLRACLKRLVHIGAAGGGSLATDPVMDSLAKIFDMFSQTYKKMKEDDARREQEEAAAYKYKTKSVNIETKEELDEKVHSQDFPNYFKEFNAIVEEIPAADPNAPIPGENPDAMDQQEKSSTQAEASALAASGITYRFSEEEAYDICRAHWLLFSVWNKAEGASVSSISADERALAYQQAYNVASDLHRLLSDKAPAPLRDDVLKIAHAIQLRAALHNGTALPIESENDKSPHFAHSPLWTAPALPTNFYSAPNAAEVNLILAPVRAAQAKIQSLLNEPEIGQNEILLMLNRILQRLIELKLHSPLMQFMTGAEVFLRKAQDWELYQPVRYSMKDELEPILRVVSRWRRLELEYWPRILIQKRQQSVTKSSHWWFYMYGVVCDSQDALEDIQKALQTFIETSSYGEYQPRIAMLFSFYNQLCFQTKQATFAGDIQRATSLKNMLLNLFKYYEQFVPALESEMEELTKPIQEKLTDFIKISRWDDASVYRLEKSADTSHRALSKFSRQYDEKVLKLPIQSLLNRLNNNASSTKDTVIPATVPLVEETQLLVSKELAEKYSRIQSLFPADYRAEELTRLHSIFSRFTSISNKRIVPKMLDVQRSAANSINDLTEAIIENSHAIRAKPDEFTGVQKRRALLSLFNHLSKMGMDFHTTTYSSKQLDINFLMQEQVPPRSITLPDLHSPDLAAVLQHQWSRADSYFYRDLTKIFTLRQCQTEHNRALSLAELRKMNGFSEHVFSLLRVQRATLGSLCSTNERLAAFTRIADAEVALTATDSLAAPVHPLAVRDLVHLTHQLIMTMANQISTIQPHAALISDPTAIQAQKDLDQVLNRLWALASEVFSFQSSLVADMCVPWSALIRVTGCIQRLQQVSSESIVAVKSLFGQQNPDFVTGWEQFVRESLQRVETQAAELMQHTLDLAGAPASLCATVQEQTLSVTREIQLAVQHVLADIEKALQPPPKSDDEMQVDVKPAESQPSEKPADDAMDTDEQPKPEEAKPEEEDTGIEAPDVEINIVSKTHTLATGFVGSSRLASITDQLASLHSSCLAVLNDAAAPLQHKASVLVQLAVCQMSLAPILHQLHVIVSSAMAGLLEHHVALAKLEYVMVSVFIGLCRDGYCAGSEEDGSAPQEGETLTGVEGTGIGEGQGEKDVSDKYEDEDQILGEKRDEEREEEQEGEKPPVDRDTGVEMENDFEGDIRDVASKEEDDDDQEQEEDENQKPPDREMGDLDPAKEEVVDEKLWDSSEEEEDEPENDKKKPEEKYEKNAPAPNEKDKKKDTEMAAKPEDEAANDGGDQGPEDAAEDQGSESGAEEFPEKNEEDDQGEEEINEDGEDKYEDNHHVQPHGQDEEVELPDDMNLDGGDEEEEGDKNDEDGGEDVENPTDLPPETEQPPENFPEQPDQQEDEANAETNPEGEEQTGQEDNQEPAPQPPAEPVNDAMDVDEEGDKDEEEDKPDIDANLNAQQQDAMEAYGIQDSIGLPQQNIKNKVDDQTDQANNEQEVQMNEDEQKAASADVQSSQKDSTAASGPSTTKQQDNVDRRPKDPNPFRSLSETLEHWKKRLNVAEDVTDESKPPQDSEARDNFENEDQQYEYVRDEEMAESETLGAATEEQANKMDMQDGMFQEEKQTEDEKQPERPPEKEDDQVAEDQEAAQSEKRSSRIASRKDDAPEDSKTVETENEKPKVKEEPQDSRQDDMEVDAQLDSDVVSKGVKTLSLEEQFDPATQERKFSQHELMEMRQQLELEIAQWRADTGNMALGMDIWRQLSAIVNANAQHLCEQLRLVLEPTQKAKLQGDYRTGKRINMRRVITYVASQFRKDKIWLRRTQPNKRNYQVLLAIDDTQSVRLSGHSALLREAVATIAIAMQRLQVGQIALAKFGKAVDLLHSFSQPFTDEAAAHAMPRLTFDQTSTNMEELLRVSVQMLEHSRDMDGATDTMQLMLVIGDGRFGDKRNSMKQWLHKAQEQNIFVVFIIVDANQKESILDIQSISNLKGQMIMKPYMDEFPFTFYMVLKNISTLSSVLGDALRQWIEMVAK